MNIVRLKINIIDKDNILALLQINDAILSMKELFIHINTSNIAKLLCDNILVHNENFSDLVFKCIGDIMKIGHIESHTIIKGFMDKLNNERLLHKFMQVIIGVLNSSKNNLDTNLPLCKIG